MSTDTNLNDSIAVMEGSTDTGGAGAGGSTGGALKPYMAQLPDNLKKNETIAKFDSFGDLANEYLSLHGKVEGAVFVPGKDSTDAERAAFRQKLGIPESADAYDIKTDNLPQGLEVTEEAMKFLKQRAFERGLNNEQAQGVFDDWNEEQARREEAKIAARKKSMEEGIVALRKDWGGDYESKVARAAKAFQTFSELAGVNIQQELAALENLDNNPALLRVFSTIGDRISEDTGLPGAGSTQPKVKTDALGRPLLTPESFNK